LAIAEVIGAKVPQAEFLYVGLQEGMEAHLVPEAGLPFRGISGRGLPRRVTVDLLKTIGSNMRALYQTKKILRDFHPDLVVGTGGFVSGPVILVASFFGIPTLLHEQNALPGVTNKLLARRVKKVMVAFADGQAYFPKAETVVVGLPVRSVIGQISRADGLAAFNLQSGKKTVLVTGGSRGAQSLNRAMGKAAIYMASRSDLQLIWATGTLDYEACIAELDKAGLTWQRPGWHIAPYIKTMPEALAAADLCICRAGASTLAELSASGRASVLVPYPFAAENHQEYNARALAERGAARLILDRDLTGEGIWQQIAELTSNPFLLESMGARAREAFPHDALDRIVNICLETAWR